MGIINADVFSKNMSEYRRSKKITQYKLADTIGVSSVYISSLERGKKTPSLSTAIRIAEALDVSLDKLILRKNQSGDGNETDIVKELFEDCSHEERKGLVEAVEFLKKWSRRQKKGESYE